MATNEAVTDQHDSDVWETHAGWVWSCRTCLDSGISANRAEAQKQRARHDARPLPWWLKRINRGQP